MTTPVNMVTGVGPKTVEYLKKRRITTAEALVKRGISVLEVAPGFSPGRAANVIEAANKLLRGEPVIVKTAKPVIKAKAEKPAKKEKNKKEKKKDKKSKDKKGKKDKKNKKDKKSKNKKDKKKK
ncbi:MAG: helix-hairpin-helix domain-containing protein [Gammaproteobacteria bacterium]|jgi:hypothetical protein